MFNNIKNEVVAKGFKKTVVDAFFGYIRVNFFLKWDVDAGEILRRLERV